MKRRRIMKLEKHHDLKPTTQSEKDIDRNPQTNNTIKKSSKNHPPPCIDKLESKISRRNTRNNQKDGLKPTTKSPIVIRTDIETSEKRPMNKKK